MTSRITSDKEFEACVSSKATGEEDGGYIISMDHEKVALKRALLAHVPTHITADRIMDNGLPQVRKNSMHLMQNLQEAIKPSPKSPAMMIAMNELIAEGNIKRIPSIVRKENDSNANRVSYHKAYLYVDAKCACPEWWVRGLNEKGDIRHISYKNFSRRTPVFIEQNATLTSRCRNLLPESPSPDVIIDPNTTPGTTRWLIAKLGIANTLENRIKISSVMKSYARKGKIGKVIRKNSMNIQGKGTVSIFYKLN